MSDHSQLSTTLKTLKEDMSPAKGKRVKDFFASSGSDSLKYSVRTKLDLYTHQALEEYANTFHNGSLSGAVRDLVSNGLKIASDENKLSASGMRKIMNIERRQRELDQRQLEIDYIDLQNNYDPEFEKVLIASAKEKGLEYPPNVDQLELWQIDENLVSIMDAVKKSSNGRSGTTLRAVYRRTGMSSEDTLYHLKRLRNFDKVEFDDVATGQQCVIKLKN